jgi:hypothetical protein
MLKQRLALSGWWRAWSGAITVLAITAVLVALAITVAPVHCYWSGHSFTSSVLSGLLVLLLTVLILDRVTRFRRLKINRERSQRKPESFSLRLCGRRTPSPVCPRLRTTESKPLASGVPTRSCFSSARLY